MITTILSAIALLPNLGPNFETEFDTALGAAGLNTSTARFDSNLSKLFGQGEFTAPFFEACSENPWRIPFFVDTLRKEFSSANAKPNEELNSGTRLLGYGTRRTLLTDASKGWQAAAAKPNAFAAELDDLKKRGIVKGNIPAFGEVPGETLQAATIILEALKQALPFRKMAFAGTDVASAYEFLQLTPDDNDPEAVNKMLRLDRNVGMGYLGAGGHDLLLAAQAANSLLSTVPSSKVYDFKLDTSWGTIHLSGGTASIYEDPSSLLIIDSGGDDLYVGMPSNASVNNWASIVIDTSGDDTYVSDRKLTNQAIAKYDGRKSTSNKPGPGGALCGYAVIIDDAGKDVYRTHRPGLGSGRFGVGCLLDMQGDDTYDANQDSEGFGSFGVGILEDVKGADVYQGFTQVQGCGLTMGFGYLVDHAGNDQYIANDLTIDFPSAQSAQHQNSMSQGAGYGRRADFLEGGSLSGGVGILFDEGGDDKYSCGVFGQGVGYWKGVGMLWDTAGSDQYLGQWYVQGAAAHFALGYLEDSEGDDTYTAPMNMAQGAGHDFSIGWLLDRAGDDHHVAPNLSLGAGNANGIGIYVDISGNDTYEASGLTLGKAAEAPKGSLRSRALCLGVFMDLAGRDSYPASTPWALNGSRSANWTDRGPTAAEGQVGVFLDE